MGHRLEEQGFAVHSYDVGFSGGEAWTCSTASGCGVHPMGAWRITADSGGIEQQGYDGVLFVGPIHASPPAADSLPLKRAQ
jgi:hypothetical protein